MDLRAVPVLQRLYVLVPGGVKFCNIILETRHYCSADALDLALGLRMIFIYGQLFNAKTDSNCSKEL